MCVHSFNLSIVGIFLCIYCMKNFISNSVVNQPLLYHRDREGIGVRVREGLNSGNRERGQGDGNNTRGGRRKKVPDPKISLKVLHKNTLHIPPARLIQPSSVLGMVPLP